MEPTIEDIYRRITQRQALLSDRIGELAYLHAEQGADISVVSSMLDSRPAAPSAHVTIKPSTETEPCPPPEMDARAPSTVPPSVDAPDVPSSRPAPTAVEETGKRAKTMTTAMEWACSPDFLAFMKTEPFCFWTHDKLTEIVPQFIASVPADKRQNRWGKTFRKFVGAT